MSYQCKLDERSYYEVLKSLRNTYKTLDLRADFSHLDLMIEDKVNQYLWVVFSEETLCAIGGNFNKENSHKTINFLELMDKFAKKYLFGGESSLGIESIIFSALSYILNESKQEEFKEEPKKEKYIISSCVKDDDIKYQYTHYHIFYDIEEAKKEAERMAKENPNCSYTVLKFEGTVSCKGLVWE